MKSIMLLGTLASATTMNVAPVAHNNEAQSRAHSRDNNYIDPYYQQFGGDPRYILSGISSSSAKNFDKMAEVKGEVDKCATDHHYPDWYKMYPDTDPSFNINENPNHERTMPLTLSQTLSNIHLFWTQVHGGTLQLANDKTFWNLSTDGSEATIITFTFKDTNTGKTQDISLYYNVASLTSHPNDDGFVAVMPGVKKVIEPSGVETKELNVQGRHTCNVGTYVEDNIGSYIYETTPTLFGQLILLKEVNFVGRASSNNILNGYMMSSRNGRGGANHAYYGDLLSGFEDSTNRPSSSSPLSYTLPRINFREGSGIFYNVAHSFAEYVYKTINNPPTRWPYDFLHESCQH